MKRTRRVAFAESPQMTSMIDVVFLLLTFFAVTFRPVEPVTSLDSPVAGGGRSASLPTVFVRVTRGPAFFLESRAVDAASLSDALASIALRSTRQGVLVICDPDSPHAKLVQVLDMCAEAGIVNVSVTSSQAGRHAQAELPAAGV